MNRYIETSPEIWSGRRSNQQLYLHEKVTCINIEKENIASIAKKTIALLGYACDEGVERNQGRIGAIDGPNAIRSILGKYPNHLDDDVNCIDAGTLECKDGKLENIQTHLAEKVTLLLNQNAFPIIIGGGHDIAYGHYNGIRDFITSEKTIGIINFDAHFDLRSNENGNNSGTPFYQIAEDCKKNGSLFKYLCLGVRKDANDKALLKTARELRVDFIENAQFNISYIDAIKHEIFEFINEVDYIYTTIDLDGFSSAYAPGVSAPSPIGFSPNVVLEVLKIIIDSKKLISIDIAEMNPVYDIDNQTAKLAASMIHYIMHRLF